MANAVNYAPRKLSAIGPTLVGACITVGKDIGAGAFSTARLAAMLVGCIALLAAGVLVSSEHARFALEARFSGSETAVRVDQDDAQAADVPAPVIGDDPQQKRVVQYLARRYRVADGAVRPLVLTAFQIGRERSLDPLLILAVVAIESGLNPFAESAMGAQGLMQVMTRVHAQRFEPHGGEMAALDPIANMKVGSSILHELISRGGSVERGLQLYVGAGNMPDDGGYGARVLGERARLHMAASGKVDAALSSAIRAAAAPPPVPALVPAALPANADLNAPPLEPAQSQPPPNSTTEAQQIPLAREQSV